MHDPVNSPKHYADTDGGIECIEAIEASMSTEEFKRLSERQCSKVRLALRSEEWR